MWHLFRNLTDDGLPGVTTTRQHHLTSWIPVRCCYTSLTWHQWPPTHPLPSTRASTKPNLANPEAEKWQSPSIPWSTATPPHALTSGSQPSQSGLASTWCLDADWSLCWRQTNPGFWLAVGERNQSAHHPASTWRGHRPEPVKHWQLTITYPLCTASIHIIHS